LNKFSFFQCRNKLSEQSILAVLSGNLKAFIPFCLNWADKLWAYCRASIDVQIERELAQTNIERQITARIPDVVSSAQESRLA
jgi:Nuclear pore protein 84 / 107